MCRYAFAILTVVPNLIIEVYSSLIVVKKQSDMNQVHTIVVSFVYTIYGYVLLSAPAIAAGLVTSSVEEIKLTLHDKLLVERNEDRESSLEDFITYIDGHPMQFTVFKIIPLDWTLPVTIINLSISYQIIIVQITKLY
ncbi:uncharacterized protein LOC114351133 [Ostrinia furnacalis]|uniref:uncharacterized protein LOC114351133 n=1 Tax=Ostrinia furnacalis TaxID=93504 RepID=UPI0010408EE0|nr:uncharacterized protein LOC114351133 [Ostrinia furnacalis]